MFQLWEPTQRDSTIRSVVSIHNLSSFHNVSTPIIPLTFNNPAPLSLLLLSKVKTHLGNQELNTPFLNLQTNTPHQLTVPLEYRGLWVSLANPRSLVHILSKSTCSKNATWQPAYLAFLARKYYELSCLFTSLSSWTQKPLIIFTISFNHHEVQRILQRLCGRRRKYKW